VQGVDKFEIVNNPVVPDKQFIKKLFPCLAPPKIEMRLQGSLVAAESPKTTCFTCSFTTMVDWPEPEEAPAFGRKKIHFKLIFNFLFSLEFCDLCDFSDLSKLDQQPSPVYAGGKRWLGMHAGEKRCASL
jgi:hypothetical protein